MLQVAGWFLFDLKATHGLPIDFALDKIMEHKATVEWPSFIERARKCGRWDFQTYRELSHALEDSSVGRGARKDILDGFKRYVLANPQ